MGWGVPGERKLGRVFWACLLLRSHFWPKLSCGLSLATMLALEQVSVASDLKGEDVETRQEQSRNNSNCTPATMEKNKNSLKERKKETIAQEVPIVEQWK